ncbi:MAG: ATP-binding cassette domain-containing protein [Oscillospiraceae bacterium]|jgi:ATPase subunit of ABC transporter with duplicated ATPase domains|nr:ATP-binding cassette domain-containing protein [Oscillospiraceae bacterium]
MSVISVSDAGKDFGDVTILEHITFEVQKGQRVGLVGSNGAGKTTLLKLLSGVYESDSGSVYIPPSVKVGVLDQLPSFSGGSTVEQVLRTAFAELEGMKRRMDALERRLAEGGGAEASAEQKALLREYGEISSAYETLGGYQTDAQLRRVANGLGIPGEMLGSLFTSLSGGEQTRINLGRLILMNVDLLLLDEPTNHLDMRSVEWLEQFLESYKGTAVIISHDRYFLDRVVDRIIEIENLTAAVYEGNYSKYVYLKEEWLKAAEAKINQAEKKISQLEFTIMRMHGNNTEKQHKRAFAMEKRVERMRKELPKIIKQGRNIKASFGGARRPGNDILQVSGLSKSYGGRTLFSDAELELKMNDRVAIIGSNGSGKTTLLKILTGEEPPDAGRIKWGVGIKRAYLEQKVSFLNERTTVLDCLCTELKIAPSTARNLLGRYNFSGKDVFKLVMELSGGEKSRLKLCILMYEGVNMLILDEPTNHLDIRSREWIEQAIEEFEGTLLLVSHDRYFVGKFAQRIWSVEDGGITEFDGSYAEYREYAERVSAAEAASAATALPETGHAAKPEDSPAAERRSGGAPKKRSREHDAMRKRLTNLERDIERQELVVSSFSTEIDAASSDHIRLTELLEEKETEVARLDEMLAEWDELVEILQDV